MAFRDPFGPIEYQQMDALISDIKAAFTRQNLMVESITVTCNVNVVSPDAEDEEHEAIARRTF